MPWVYHLHNITLRPVIAATAHTFNNLSILVNQGSLKSQFNSRCTLHPPQSQLHKYCFYNPDLQLEKLFKKTRLIALLWPPFQLFSYHRPTCNPFFMPALYCFSPFLFIFAPPEKRGVGFWGESGVCCRLLSAGCRLAWMIYWLSRLKTYLVLFKTYFTSLTYILLVFTLSAPCKLLRQTFKPKIAGCFSAAKVTL